MSQKRVNEPQNDQAASTEPSTAGPEDSVLDQYLDIVPMQPQEDTRKEDTLQDYTDKHLESVTASPDSEPAESDTEDSVDELLQEAETPEAPLTLKENEPEEITLLDDEQVVMHESPDDDISLMPDPDTPPEQTATTSNPDDALATQTTVDSVVEAVLFACDEPVTVAKLAGIVECTPKQIKTSVEALNQQYKQHNRAFRIEQIAGGLQMLTLPYYDHWLRKMIKVRADNKLTPSALETLAIVAYKQPAIRADIEAIRGVASGEMLRGLMVKGLVKMVGRAEVVGRPMQYGTTKKFLECFGLNSLKDLPQIEELKRPQVESDENEDAD
jgi:segregation and condensation protein B